MCGDPTAEAEGTLGNNTIFGPVQDARSLYTVDDTALLGKSILVVDKPRITVYRNTWRVHQNTVYWGTLKLAQRKGLQFYQTRSHAIALFQHTSCDLY